MVPNILIRFVVASACNKSAVQRRLARSRSFTRIPRPMVEEALLQLHLFAGFPAAIEAFSLLNRRGKSRKAPDGRESIVEQRRRGVALCRKVYGSSYKKLLQNLRHLHPEFAEWILDYGYGRVLSRPRLSLKNREILAIAVLAALGWERQLRSHIRGALHVLVSSREIRNAISQAERVPGIGLLDKTRRIAAEYLRIPKKSLDS